MNLSRRVRSLEHRLQAMRPAVQIDARPLLAAKLEAIHQRHTAARTLGEAEPVLEVEKIKARLKARFEERANRMNSYADSYR